ncbi:MAG: hypothetical protein IPL78_08285 [Chloroflexi bacterium]|nr:hypothetical protein [Chloroflexota bacterium]
MRVTGARRGRGKSAILVFAIEGHRGSAVGRLAVASGAISAGAAVD